LLFSTKEGSKMSQWLGSSRNLLNQEDTRGSTWCNPIIGKKICLGIF
jgi:hypothetical protein